MTSKFEQAKEEIRRQGFRISDRAEDMELFKNTLLPTFAIFQKELKTVSCLFTYRQQEQTTETGIKADGLTIYSLEKNTLETMFSIGISTKALEKGKNYASLVFMHELSHVRGFLDASGELAHDNFFHAYLDKLIERYNRETGETVKNDYFGLWAKKYP